ncbi:MAG TPA: CidA/LrgA family protein [Sedimentisphaerales bacterium]|jgi:holin-like protein|nr:CidA/LrgA family protein [Sedimentisphaerales bacterium]HNU30899.1 CidA/LrgA family protein [Sedimentisphaerales bacterium]
MVRKETVYSFALLLAFLGIGNAISLGFRLHVPGNVIGMILLTVCLLAKVIDIRRVEPAADMLLSEIGLFFVPPGVAVMLYFDLIAQQWLPLLAGIVGSLLAVLWATALTARLLEKKDAEKS